MSSSPSVAAASNQTPCGACKFMRRKCPEQCIFAPYFPPENTHKFIDVHTVYGAYKVAKILKELNPNERQRAVDSLCYEAKARRDDPIHGCVMYMAVLQERIHKVQMQIDSALRELAPYMGPNNNLLFHTSNNAMNYCSAPFHLENVAQAPVFGCNVEAYIRQEMPGNADFGQLWVQPSNTAGIVGDHGGNGEVLDMPLLPHYDPQMEISYQIPTNDSNNNNNNNNYNP